MPNPVFVRVGQGSKVHVVDTTSFTRCGLWWRVGVNAATVVVPTATCGNCLRRSDR